MKFNRKKARIDEIDRRSSYNYLYWKVSNKINKKGERQLYLYKRIKGKGGKETLKRIPANMKTGKRGEYSATRVKYDKIGRYWDAVKRIKEGYDLKTTAQARVKYKKLREKRKKHKLTRHEKEQLRYIEWQSPG